MRDHPTQQEVCVPHRAHEGGLSPPLRSGAVIIPAPSTRSRKPPGRQGLRGWGGRWRSGLPAVWFGGRGQGLRGRAGVPSTLSLGRDLKHISLYTHTQCLTAPGLQAGFPSESKTVSPSFPTAGFWSIQTTGLLKTPQVSTQGEQGSCRQEAQEVPLSVCSKYILNFHAR